MTIHVRQADVRDNYIEALRLRHRKNFGRVIERQNVRILQFEQ